MTAGEDWTERADPDYVDGDCASIAACPAPHDGYLTYGDANGRYDQSAGLTPVVREEWITAKALVAVPNLGWFRVGVDAAVTRVGLFPTALGVGGAAGVAGGFGALFLSKVGGRRRGRAERDR